MTVIQLAVHTRHLGNLLLFRAIIKTDQIRGRIEYLRLLLLRTSAAELLSFSGLFFLLFVFTKDWVMLGVASSCLSTAAKHRRLFRTLSPGTVCSVQPQHGT